MRHASFIQGELSRAEHFAAHEVSLPLHPFMSDDDASAVIDAVNTFGHAR
jgi:dTDP-4-amino-4,6-dideoxygalactose transaminase